LAVVMGTDLVYEILSSPGDLRVRFAGPNGNRDFTIPHSIVLALAGGFGKECLD